MSEAARGVRVDPTTFTYEASSEKWALDVLGNWTNRETNPDGSGSYQDQEDRTHNFANEIDARDTDGDGNDDITISYDDAGNIRDVVEGTKTTRYTHDMWNRMVEVEIESGTGMAREDQYGLMSSREVFPVRAPSTISSLGRPECRTHGSTRFVVTCRLGGLRTFQSTRSAPTTRTECRR